MKKLFDTTFKRHSKKEDLALDACFTSELTENCAEIKVTSTAAIKPINLDVKDVSQTSIQRKFSKLDFYIMQIVAALKVLRNQRIEQQKQDYANYEEYIIVLNSKLKNLQSYVIRKQEPGSPITEASILESFYSSKHGAVLCEQHNILSLILDFFDYIRLQSLLVSISTSVPDDDATTPPIISNTIITESFVADYYLLLQFIPAILANKLLAERLQCEILQLIYLLCEMYSPELLTLRERLFQFFSHIQWSSNLVWFLHDNHCISILLRNLNETVHGQLITTENKKQAIQWYKENESIFRNRSRIFQYDEFDTNNTENAVSEALGLNLLPSPTTSPPTEQQETSMNNGGIDMSFQKRLACLSNRSHKYIIASYTNTDGHITYLRTTILILTQSRGFSDILLFDFEKYHGYEILHELICSCNELKISEVLFQLSQLYTKGPSHLMLDEKVTDTSGTIVNNLRAFNILRDVLVCILMNNTQPRFAHGFLCETERNPSKSRILQLLSSVLHVFSLDYKNFLTLEHETNILSNALALFSTMPSSDEKALLLKIVEYVASLTKQWNPSIEKLLVECCRVFCTLSLTEIALIKEQATAPSSTVATQPSTDTLPDSLLIGETIRRILSQRYATDISKTLKYTIFVGLQNGGFFTMFPEIMELVISSNTLFVPYITQWNRMLCLLIKKSSHIFKEMTGRYWVECLISNVRIPEFVMTVERSYSTSYTHLLIALLDLSAEELLERKEGEMETPTIQYWQCFIESFQLPCVINNTEYYLLLLQHLKSILTHSKAVIRMWNKLHGNTVLLAGFQLSTVSEAEFYHKCKQFDAVLEILSISQRNNCNEDSNNDDIFLTLSKILACWIEKETNDKILSIFLVIFRVIINVKEDAIHTFNQIEGFIQHYETVILLFYLLPSIPEEIGILVLQKITSLVCCCDMICKNEQMKGLLDAGFLEWLGSSTVLQYFAIESVYSPYFCSLLRETSSTRLDKKSLQCYLRIVDDLIKLSKTTTTNDKTAKSIGYHLLENFAMSSDVRHVPFKVKGEEKHCFVHIACTAGARWPPDSSYSFSCWLLIPLTELNTMKSPSISKRSSDGCMEALELHEGMVYLSKHENDTEGKEYFAILVGRQLSLYVSKEEASLSTVTPVYDFQLTNLTYPSSAGPIHIHTSDGVYYFRCNNEEEKISWLASLRRVLGGTSTEPPIDTNRYMFLACFYSSTSNSTSSSPAYCYTKLYFDRVMLAFIAEVSVEDSMTSNKKNLAIFTNPLITSMLSSNDGSWHSMVINHKKSALGFSSMTLYIDGCEIDTKKLAFPSSNCDGLLEAYIGYDALSTSTETSKSRYEYFLGPCCLISEMLSIGSIQSMYLLGPMYKEQFTGYDINFDGSGYALLSYLLINMCQGQYMHDEISLLASSLGLSSLSKTVEVSKKQTMLLVDENKDIFRSQSGMVLYGAYTSLRGKNKLPDDVSISMFLEYLNTIEIAPNPQHPKDTITQIAYSSFQSKRYEWKTLNLEVAKKINISKLKRDAIVFSLNNKRSNYSIDNLADSTVLCNCVETSFSMKQGLGQYVACLGGLETLLACTIKDETDVEDISIVLRMILLCARSEPAILDECIHLRFCFMLLSILWKRPLLLENHSLTDILFNYCFMSHGGGENSIIWNIRMFQTLLMCTPLWTKLSIEMQLHYITQIHGLVVAKNQNSVFNCRQICTLDGILWLLQYWMDFMNSTTRKFSASFPSKTKQAASEVSLKIIQTIRCIITPETYIEDIDAIINAMACTLGFSFMTRYLETTAFEEEGKIEAREKDQCVRMMLWAEARFSNPISMLEYFDRFTEFYFEISKHSESEKNSLGEQQESFKDFLLKQNTRHLNELDPMRLSKLAFSLREKAKDGILYELTNDTYVRQMDDARNELDEYIIHIERNHLKWSLHTNNNVLPSDFSVYQSVMPCNALDQVEGPYRLRLKFCQDYQSNIKTDNEHPSKTAEQEALPQGNNAGEVSPDIQHCLEFHEAVEAYKEMISVNKATIGLNKRKYQYETTNQIMQQSSDPWKTAKNIFEAFFDASKVLLPVTKTAIKELSDMIENIEKSQDFRNLQNIFELANAEAIQYTLRSQKFRLDVSKEKWRQELEPPSEDVDEESSPNLTQQQQRKCIEEEETNLDMEDYVERTEEEGERDSNDKSISSMTSTRSENSDVLKQQPSATTDKQRKQQAFRAIECLIEDDSPLRAYNCSRLLEMRKQEGILVFCKQAVYYISGFYKKDDSNHERKQEDNSNVSVQTENDEQKGKHLTASLLTSKTKNILKQTVADISEQTSKLGLLLEQDYDYIISPIEQSNDTPSATTLSPPSKLKMSYSQIKDYYRMRYQLRHVALEIFQHTGENVFLIMSTTSEREEIFRYFFAMPIENSIFQNHILNANAATFSVRSLLNSATRKWLRGAISNYDYLMRLNTFAGRSFNDLTQYPIFPWVLSDYTSSVLDLTLPNVYRDLSKPMGALGGERAKKFIERYESIKEECTDRPAFHYGTHYSCSAYVINYLIRLEPFTRMAKDLQGGHFDKSDRLFYNLNASWKSASSENLQDVRELIPEFYSLPEILYNGSQLDFGTLQCGDKVDHVVLPPWALGDPREFVRLHRQALESRYVSENLHKWIDLVFGYKQQGVEAELAQNVFMHTSYEGYVDIDKIDDPLMKEATIAQIENFGQTPSQLFSKPHPARQVPDVQDVIIRPDMQGNITTQIDYALRWHLPLTPSLTLVGRLDVQLRQSNLGNIKIDKPVGDIRTINDKIYAREISCVLHPPTFTKYFRFGDTDGGMSLHIHQLTARHREVNKTVSIIEGIHEQKINCVSISNSGDVLATGSEDGTVGIIETKKDHNARHFQIKKRLSGHADAVVSLAMSKEFGIVVSGSKDKTAVIWDLTRLRFLRRLGRHRGTVSFVDINKVCGNILTVAEDEMYLWSINGDLLTKTNIPANNLSLLTCLRSTKCDWWNDGVIAVTGHLAGDIVLWGLDYPSNLSLKTAQSNETKLSCQFVVRSILHGHQSAVTALHLPDDQRQVLSGDRAGYVLRWISIDSFIEKL